MDDMDTIFWRVFEEASAARAHFHTWWALRNLALPEYYETMNKTAYVDFFHVANSGNFKLIFISLSKIFDRDTRVASISNLKQSLETNNHSSLVSYIENNLNKHQNTITKIHSIRHQSVAHNQADIPRDKVYSIADITADEIKSLISETCDTLNHISRELGYSTAISDGERHESATLELLKSLKNANT